MRQGFLEFPWGHAPAPKSFLPYFQKYGRFGRLRAGQAIYNGGTDGEVKVGTPTVEGAKVTGKVLGHGKAAKILIYKYKSKKNYHRRAGHRQPFTKVEITIG